MQEDEKSCIDVAIAAQVTTARQRTRLLIAVQKSFRKEAKKMGLNGMPKEEVKQVLDAFLVLGEVKQ